MYPSTQSFHSVQTIFGTGYIPEDHTDDARRNLPSKERLDFSAVLKALRAALGIEQGK
jgi:hypothetical protein